MLSKAIAVLQFSSFYVHAYIMSNLYFEYEDGKFYHVKNCKDINMYYRPPCDKTCKYPGQPEHMQTLNCSDYFLMCTGISPHFSAIFLKGDNFFTHSVLSWATNPFQKGVYSE